MKLIAGRRINAIAFFLAGCLLATGCATARKMTYGIIDKGRTLKKSIVLTPDVISSGCAGKDCQNTAVAQLRAFLGRHCDGLIIVDSQKIREELEEIPRLPSSRIENLALAEFGRIHGLGVVLELSIGEIECLTGKRGIWGFRRTCMLAQCSLHVRAFDVETTAVLLDRFVREAVEISEYDCNNIKKGDGYNKEIADRLLAKLTPRIGKMICKGLSDKPWKGYIISSSDKTYTVSGGTDAGLATGDVLEVFQMSEQMKGQGGQVYLVSGPKIGEIRVTKVQRDRVEAICLSGHDLEKSICVKLKR